jgi:hypothetical protein
VWSGSSLGLKRNNVSLASDEAPPIILGTKISLASDEAFPRQ